MVSQSQTKQALSWSWPGCFWAPSWYEMSVLQPSSGLETDGATSRIIFCSSHKEHPPTEPEGTEIGAPQMTCAISHTFRCSISSCCLYSVSTVTVLASCRGSESSRAICSVKAMMTSCLAWFFSIRSCTCSLSSWIWLSLRASICSNCFFSRSRASRRLVRSAICLTLWRTSSSLSLSSAAVRYMQDTRFSCWAASRALWRSLTSSWKGNSKPSRHSAAEGNSTAQHRPNQ